MEEQVNKLVCLSNKTVRSVECQNGNNEKTKTIKNMALKISLHYINPYCFLNGIRTKCRSKIKGHLYFKLSNLILWQL